MAGRSRSRIGSPLGRSLPLLKDDYRGFSPDDYGHSKRTPRYDLEDRIAFQERTTQQLMEKSYKIKDDLLDSLNYSHGTWQEEKMNRTLLQEHIKSITEIVRQLSRDILQIERHIAAKNTVGEGAAAAVKTLEVSHVAGVTDLRSRVGRCDGAIAKLAMDLKICIDSLRTMNQQQQERAQRDAERLGSFDQKINELTMRLERMSSEQQVRLKHVEGDSSGKITSLDTKTRQLIEETRLTINTCKVTMDNEREKLEMRLLSKVERHNQSRDARIDKLEKRFDDGIVQVNIRVAKMEEDIAKDRANVNTMQTAREEDVHLALDSHRKKQTEEIQRLKRESREGFSTIQETISHIKQIMDGKSKLLQEQMQKEIGQIRKMVVLI